MQASIFKFKLTRWEKFLAAGLVAVWSLHAVNILVPETGFDALWYHLPVVRAIVSHGHLVYLPELYQSVNPLLSDLIFAVGYLIAKELGTKIIAFLFSLSLIAASFSLARKFLPRVWALYFILLISSFQVVAWQASSFYIDSAKAFWEILALNFLLSSQLALANLSFGASLASKEFSIFLLPIWSWLNFLKTKKINWTLSLTLFLPLPFYAWTYINVQQFFHSLSLNQNLVTADWLVWQTLKLPYSLVQLVFFSRDYITWLMIFLPLVLWWCFKLKKLTQELKILLLWGMSQYLLWWYLPPTSTRYSLSGFIVLTLLIIWWLKNKIKSPFWLGLILASAVIINLLPRFYVTYRSLKYLLGFQTKQQYIEQFYDGNINHLLDRDYAQSVR